MADSTTAEIKAAQLTRREQKRSAESSQRSEAESDKTSLTGVSLDSDIYETSKGSRFANHDLSIAAGTNDDGDDDGNDLPVRLLDSCECGLRRQFAAKLTPLRLLSHGAEASSQRIRRRRRRGSLRRHCKI